MSEITRSITAETLQTLRREWPDTAPDRQARPAVDTDGVVLPAREGGYLAYTAYERLVRLATEADAIIHLRLAPGQWISVGRPLLAVSPPEARERMDGDPRDDVQLGPQPTLQQDVSFGVRQLADVAVKALSPSLNDPSTAVTCVHRLTEILLEAGRRYEPPTTHADEAGVVRLIAPGHHFDDLVGLAFDQIRSFGAERLYVMLAVVEGLRELQDDLPPGRQPPIVRQADLVAQAGQAIEIDEDRDTLMRRIEELRSRSTRS